MFTNWSKWNFQDRDLKSPALSNKFYFFLFFSTEGKCSTSDSNQITGLKVTSNAYLRERAIDIIPRLGIQN